MNFNTNSFLSVISFDFVENSISVPVLYQLFTCTYQWIISEQGRAANDVLIYVYKYIHNVIHYTGQVQVVLRSLANYTYGIT